ncbi:MAG: glucosyltransferase domain-containing protein [Sedimentisphaerales bacterium]|nr:glucosyltransferase domain-containing protein [Sedimentisphaerales bacterium]
MNNVPHFIALFYARIITYLQQHLRVIVAAFVINVLAFATRLFSISYCVDDYSMMFQRPNFIAHGRWLFHFIYHYLLGSHYTAFISALIGIVFMIFAALQLCHFWRVKDAFSQIIIVSIFTIHPYLVDMYNFHAVVVAFPVGYFLAMLSLNLSYSRSGRIAAVVCVAAALGIYQPCLSVIAAAIVIRAIMQLVSESSAKMPFFRIIATIVIGVVLYFLVTKLVFLLTNVRPNPRFEQGLIASFAQIKQKIGWVILILSSRVLPIPEFVLPFQTKIVLFATTVVCCVGTVLYSIKRVPRSLWRVFVVVLLFAIAPLAAILHVLPTSVSQLPWRTSLGLVTVFVGSYAIFAHVIRDTWLRVVNLLLIVVLALFCLQDNALAFQQHLRTQRDISLATRIASRIESLPEYNEDLSLVVLGNTRQYDFHKEDKTTQEIITQYLEYCSRRQYSVAVSAFVTDWSKYAILLDFLELNNCRPTADQIDIARQQAASREPYPHPSSVFVYDDMVIVILAQDD